VYCAATADALRHFQHARGLRVDDGCDGVTWAALVEASWEIGDRLLYLTSPMLRGDDVGDLQGRLCRLGFDCGRVDAIYGPQTAHAVEEFQHNCGMVPDGVCGHDTVRSLLSLSRRTGDGRGVAQLRELEFLRRTRRSVDGLRVVVGQFGGLSALGRTITRELRHHGAVVVSIDELEPGHHAVTANRFGADLYVGIEASASPEATIAYYAVPAFESVGGRSLAEQVAARLDALGLEIRPSVVGMRLSVLRETRMPAVLCTLGPVRAVVDRSPALAEALLGAIVAWLRTPIPVD
jgi:N-acetylmuramoyl-L-alanine amidase